MTTAPYIPAASTTSNSAFCICGLYMILSVNNFISLNNINHLDSVMEMQVLFSVRTELLNII
jgi:hypothetical protein